MNCPADATTLRPVDIGQGVAFKCDRCRGIWLSRATIRTLSELLAGPGVFTPPSTRHKLGAGVRPCPVCSPDLLAKLPTHGIEVDACPNCHGVWLDAGELKLVIARGPRQPHRGVLDNKALQLLDGSFNAGTAVDALANIAPPVIEAGAAGLEAIGEVLLDVISALSP
jgi:Zn-finger nucleic acid-binding protein